MASDSRSIDGGKKLDEIALDMAWYKEWTGKIDPDKLGRLPYTPAWPGLGSPVEGDAVGR